MAPFPDFLSHRFSKSTKLKVFARRENGALQFVIVIDVGEHTMLSRSISPQSSIYSQTPSIEIQIHCFIAHIFAVMWSFSPLRPDSGVL
jgi:hypothetical protein